jgi:predicted transcriptional regulator
MVFPALGLLQDMSKVKTLDFYLSYFSDLTKEEMKDVLDSLVEKRLMIKAVSNDIVTYHFTTLGKIINEELSRYYNLKIK